jgi:hypothetical protein
VFLKRKREKRLTGGGALGDSLFFALLTAQLLSGQATVGCSKMQLLGAQKMWVLGAQKTQLCGVQKNAINWPTFLEKVGQTFLEKVDGSRAIFWEKK